MRAPQLKYSIYEMLEGQGVATCPTCGLEQQLIGEQYELDDRQLLVQLDSSWQKICDLLDLGLAELTTPPER